MEEHSLKEAALALWAKSDPPRSLLAHMLDTAAMALALLEREPERTQRLYAQDWGLPVEEALRFAAFGAGLHDLGKGTPSFQSGWPEGAERVRKAGLTWDEGYLKDKEDWVAHGVFTELLVSETLKEKGLPLRIAASLAMALGAHHGFPAQVREKRKGKAQLQGETPLWKKVRAFLVETLWDALGRPLPLAERATPQAVLRVMALASFADWLASDPSFYTRIGRSPLDPDHLEEALKEARRFLEELGWRIPQLPIKGFEILFPFSPNALQSAVIDILSGPNPGQEPVLLLVEAPMGMGKTEAALYAYLQLKERLGHRGLYVGLPTQATANGLFPRVKAFLERLGEGFPLDLQLQHGSALLNPQYQDLLERVRPSQVYDRAEKEAEGAVSASLWFSARKRAMLSPHGVGTLDQALLGVLKVKHHFVRLWGLMNRVVVLDEVHAYDTYTSGLLKALLRWLRGLGSSVVLMTATLPSQKREELFKAWGVEGGAMDMPPYPRVVALAGGKPLGGKSFGLDETRKVRLKAVDPDPSRLANTLIEALPGCLGAVVNTVDRAQALYQALGEGKPLTLDKLLNLPPFRDHPREGTWGALWSGERGMVVGKRLRDGTLVFLLHARFPAEERALREGVVLSLFGKGGPRPEKAILVATQVVEQSLDLDFDLLYSDLAPIDLLFQRLGRLWRHPGRDRKGHKEPLLFVGGLEGPEVWEEFFWTRVYEEYVLLSTWFSMKGRDSLDLPRDLEPLLEEVYGRTPGNFPSELRRKAKEAYDKFREAQEGEEESARNLALFHLEDLISHGGAHDLPADLRLEDDSEDQRTQRLLTRLGPPSVAVVPLYEGVFLDRERKRPVKLEGALSREEVMAIWNRAVRLSRYPIPQDLLREDPPPAWRQHGLLRGLRVLEVGRTFAKQGAPPVTVDLDPELGVVYRYR